MLNTVAGAVQSGLTWKNIDQLPSQVLSPPNSLEQIHPVSNAGDLSQTWFFFLGAPRGTGKNWLIKALQNCVNVRGKSVTAIATSVVGAKPIKRESTARFFF